MKSPRGSFELENLVDNEHIDNVEEFRTIQLNSGQQIYIYPLDVTQSKLVLGQAIICFISFLITGMMDQAVGAMMPALVTHYNIDHSQVNYIFLFAVIGYATAAIGNDWLHTKIGMRGALCLAAISFTLAGIIMSSTPKLYILYAMCYFPNGFALGILDSTTNVLFGSMVVYKNELLGVLHGIFGVSAMITPPLATYFIEHRNWNEFFYIPTIISIIAGLGFVIFFKYETGAKYQYIISQQDESDDSALLETVKHPAVLSYAMYLIMYLGSEISMGTWLLSYMMDVKNGPQKPMAYVVSCYWGGLTTGRFVLGFVTKRFFENEYRASRCYGLLSLLFMTLFVAVSWYTFPVFTWMAKIYFVFSGLLVGLCGFFMGPLFPNASVVALQLLPKKLHVSGIGSASAIGGMGGAILPGLVGTLSDKIGSLAYFPLMAWFYYASYSIIWILYPRFIKNREDVL